METPRNRAKRKHNTKLPFLPSGLYRRLRNFTESATETQLVAGFTAGGEFHPALKQTFCLLVYHRFYKMQGGVL